MVTLKLKLHPSIRESSFPEVLSAEYEGITIIEGINLITEEYPEIQGLILEDSQPKAGLLFFANKTELGSMGLMDEELDEDLLVRVVPILHGG